MNPSAPLLLRLRKLIDNMPLLDEKTKKNWHAHLKVLDEKRLQKLEKMLLKTYDQLTQAHLDYQAGLNKLQKEKINPAFQKKENQEKNNDEQKMNNLLNNLT